MHRCPHRASDRLLPPQMPHPVGHGQHHSHVLGGPLRAQQPHIRFSSPVHDVAQKPKRLRPSPAPLDVRLGGPPPKSQSAHFTSILCAAPTAPAARPASTPAPPPDIAKAAPRSESESRSTQSPPPAAAPSPNGTSLPPPKSSPQPPSPVCPQPLPAHAVVRIHLRPTASPQHH